MNVPLNPDPPPSKPKPKKPRARKVKADNNAGMAQSEQLPSATTTSSSHFINVSSADMAVPPAPVAKPKTTKPRKPRAKKSQLKDDECDILAEKTNTSKPASQMRKTAPAKVSKHFNADTLEGDTGRSTAQWKPSDDGDSIWDVPASPPLKHGAPQAMPAPVDQTSGWDLDEAVTRRRDWTPIRDTHAESAFTDTLDKENSVGLVMEGKNTFTSMLSTFTFTNGELQPGHIPKDAVLEGTTKMNKRKVELIDVPSKRYASRDPSPEKRKAPKKKMRTITDLVVGQYAPDELNTTTMADTGNFFEPRVTTKVVPLNDGQSIASKAIRPSGTRKPAASKVAKGVSKSKKVDAKAAAEPKMMADKLLSPASALLKMGNQDVLFGTSSQLALEESPTMVRQIQQAIRESEQDIDHGPLAGSPSRLRQRLRKIEGKRRLWAASSRDDGGQLLEVQEDIRMPEPDRTQDIPLLMDGTNDERRSSFADIDDYNLLPAVAMPAPSSATRITSESISETRTAGAVLQPVFNDIDDYEPPPPSNQEASSSFLDIDDFLPSARNIDRPESNQSGDVSTTSRSPTKPLCGHLPKPQSALLKPKSKSSVRKRLIAVGKSDTAELQPPSTPPTQRSRFADIEEILDSEDDEALSPTPPRRTPFAERLTLPLVPSQPALSGTASQNNKGEPDADIVPVSLIPSSQLEWEAIKPSIFNLITSHIRSIPPTTDPSKPSWHEKILMYDPIVLEDFTSYLNANTSIRTYKRATQKQIKAWNKKMKANGGDITGVDEVEGLVGAVQKELEVYMVQAWCQEMSICCMSRDGKGRGGVRRGLY
jgi:hypothetical protein